MTITFQTFDSQPSGLSEITGACQNTRTGVHRARGGTRCLSWSMPFGASLGVPVCACERLATAAGWGVGGLALSTCRPCSSPPACSHGLPPLSVLGSPGTALFLSSELSFPVMLSSWGSCCVGPSVVLLTYPQNSHCFLFPPLAQNRRRASRCQDATPPCQGPGLAWLGRTGSAAGAVRAIHPR